MAKGVLFFLSDVKNNPKVYPQGWGDLRNAIMGCKSGGARAELAQVMNIY
jgi:hypothetical protein